MAETAQQWCLDASAEIGRVNPLDAPIVAETIRCPQMTWGGNLVDRPTMREEECKRRLFSNSSCRLACPEVNHLREKLGLPLVAKREVVPVVPKQKRGRVIPRCKCGGTALLKKLIPRPLEPICRECHAIARYVYVQSASMPDKARNDARRTGMKAIIEAASNGHLPSQQWVAKNVK